jgi:hypothetical protein
MFDKPVGDFLVGTVVLRPNQSLPLLQTILEAVRESIKNRYFDLY